ncbi:MAG: HAMP domain-containing histidine kinase [Deltaproteobacteria bacterium]|nr:HAMP domain-containing histidine kinase [Deltaproteobacteria bacterium]
MRYPPFVAEMAREENRPKLWFGIWSGYAIAAAFALLALLADIFGLTPWRWAFAGLVAIKLLTNTAAMLSLRSGKGILEWSGLNTGMDTVLMTGAIYLTGGPRSPLIPIYVIEITVIALLTNTGVTLLIAGEVLLCFSLMTVLMAAGVVPDQPVPADPTGTIGPRYAIVVILYAAFVIGTPTFFTSSILGLLKRQGKALEQRTAELVEAGKERSQFLAAVTHELRTPIHGVQGMAELIETGVYGPVTDKQKDACATIKRNAQGLLGLVDDLLALTRAEMGRLEIKMAPVDLSELVTQVAGSVTGMIATKKLTLTTEVAEPLAPITSDRRLLGHVLVNLLANAAKFTPRGGRVVVRAKIVDDWAHLEVADTGVGIADSDREAIFRAFHQIEGGDERGYGGVGLGLALVQRLVTNLGGKVEVDSTLGVGSTFRVLIPA